MKDNLGKLKKIDLRKAWNHEAYDFTNWLAKEENLELLSDEIGIDIKLIETEASVGKFSLDVLAEEENSGRKIVIENQLEPTNHDHLGKIVTYASGYDAEIIIWIVSDVRDEHKRAVDWLNEHTDEEINFFVIKMELWQIGNSPFAPKFQIISKSNDWAKTIKAVNQNKMTDTKIMQLEFWNKFKEYCIANETNLKLRKTSPQHWYSNSIGSSFAHMDFTFNTQSNSIGCEIYISDSKDLYSRLFENKEKIESEIGEELEWMELPGRKASRIKISKEGDLDNTDDWEKYFSWLKENGEVFKKVFLKYIK